MKKIEFSSYKRLCFPLSTLLIVSMISAACASGAISTSPTTEVDTKVMTQVSTQALVSTPEPLATESSIPTVAQPTATASTPGILAIVPVADGPIILAATAHSIWVEAHRANIVTRIDPSQNKEVARLKDAPVHCNVVSGGGFVWATQAHSDGSPSLDEGKVTKIDPASGAVVGSIELATACGLSADNTDLWVTSPMLSQVVRYDAATLEEHAVIPLGRDVFEIMIGPDAVWAFGEADGGTIWRIDPDTNQVVTSISVPGAGPGLSTAFDAVWVGSRAKGLIYRIDPATNTVTETIEVGYPIGGIGVGPDAIWASGFGNGKISRIDPATNSISGSLSTTFGNLGPPLFAFGSIWVGALDKNVVLRIDPAAFGTSGAATP